MGDDDQVEVTLPAGFGQLFSATGEVLEGGQRGRVTRREARIYGLQAADKATDEGRPLNKWTIAQLRVYAAEEGVDLTGLTAKQDILDAIAADAAGGEEE